MEPLHQQLAMYFQQVRPFLQPTLRLTDLAKQLGSNTATVSKLINEYFTMGFNDYINQYRIEEVKWHLQKGKHYNNTLVGIARDSGFKSKATFYRAFKKQTRMTPRQYIKALETTR